jgi:hypothetical protein
LQSYPHAPSHAPLTVTLREPSPVSLRVPSTVPLRAQSQNWRITKDDKHFRAPMPERGICRGFERESRRPPPYSKLPPPEVFRSSNLVPSKSSHHRTPREHPSTGHTHSDQKTAQSLINESLPTKATPSGQLFNENRTMKRPSSS